MKKSKLIQHQSSNLVKKYCKKKRFSQEKDSTPLGDGVFPRLISALLKTPSPKGVDLILS